MMTIEKLDRQAKAMREDAIYAFESETVSMKDKVDAVILASVAMMTYQLAVGMKDANENTKPA